jgi:hypothetical protein
MAKVLRKLRITECSLVDVGAAQHAHVMLTKRNEEVHMSKSSRCPSCGQKLPDPPDDDEDTGKRLDPDTIMKGATMTSESIIKSFRDRMPGASEGAIMTAATSSPEFMKLHLDERDARQRAMGNI